MKKIPIKLSTCNLNLIVKFNKLLLMDYLILMNLLI